MYLWRTHLLRAVEREEVGRLEIKPTDAFGLLAEMTEERVFFNNKTNNLKHQTADIIDLNKLSPPFQRGNMFFLNLM